MHSEICPICQGKGQTTIGAANPNASYVESVKECHGCEGRGWIMLIDASDLEIMLNMPEFKDQMLKSMGKWKHSGGNKDERRKY